ncbi:hypothetical protein COCNU_scaffold000109G000010 [Cocos nucifera]|nr:hypothetical protein [Cocos nucifera]
MVKLISEAMIRAIEEFKTSLEMRNLNIKFGQKMFIKGFELYEGRVAQMFPKLSLSFLKEKEDDVDVGPSNAVVDPTFNELASDPSEPIVEVSKLIREPEVVESDLALPSVVPPESPTNTDPLPQGVLIKSLIKNLRRKIHLLRKKLKKMEDDFRASRKNASKDSFRKEIVELKRNANDKFWALTAKISSLEADPKNAEKKIHLLERSSPWSIDKARYDWDWSIKFFQLWKQLQDTQDWHNSYRVIWTDKMSRLEGELKVARDEVAHLRKRLHNNRRASVSGELEEIAFLKRTISEHSEVVGAEQVEVQWLKLQLTCEHRAVEDAEVKSEVLKRQQRELEGKF